MSHRSEAAERATASFLRDKTPFQRGKTAFLTCKTALLRCKTAFLPCKTALLRCKTAFLHCNCPRLRLPATGKAALFELTRLSSDLPDLHSSYSDLPDLLPCLPLLHTQTASLSLPTPLADKLALCGFAFLHQSHHATTHAHAHMLSEKFQQVLQKHW